MRKLVEDSGSVVMMFRVLSALFRVGMAFLRRFGVVFVGDTKRMACAMCGVEKVEHVAQQEAPYLSAWVSTSEHVAHCGLVCTNGLNNESFLKEWVRKERETPSPLEGWQGWQIHSVGGCPRCNRKEHDRLFRDLDDAKRFAQQYADLERAAQK